MVSLHVPMHEPAADLMQAGGVIRLALLRRWCAESVKTGQNQGVSDGSFGFAKLIRRYDIHHARLGGELLPISARNEGTHAISSWNHHSTRLSGRLIQSHHLAWGFR